MSNCIVGDYVDNGVNGGSNYSTGSNNLALLANVAAGQTLTFALDSFLGLDSLAQNGGLTQTMALFDSSPAVNAGADLTKLFQTFGQGATDQRGLSRGVVWSLGAYQDSLPGQPASITLVAGSAKSGSVGKAYARNMQVLVTDAFGKAVPGVLVTFSAPTSGPSVTFTTQIVTVSPSGNTTIKVHKGTTVTAITDANGLATALPTGNTKLGSFTATISAAGVNTPVVARLTNLPGAPASITIVAGNSQSAAVGHNYLTALAVKVLDSFGNPINGAPVTFQVPASGPSANFAGATFITVLTDAAGIATAPTLTAGAQTGTFKLLVTAGTKSASFTLHNLVSGAVRVHLAAFGKGHGHLGR
jgi:hypothetical protein